MQKNFMKKIYGFDNIEHQLGSNLNLILAKVFRSRKKNEKFETDKPVTKDTRDRLYNIRSELNSTTSTKNTFF